MDFPRALVVFYVVLVFYLASQLYLFFRARNYLRRLSEGRARSALVGITAAFFLLMLFPLAWRALFSLTDYEPYPVVVRGVFTFWAFGSAVAALILAGCDLIRRLTPLSPGTSKILDFDRRAFLRKGLGAAVAAPFLVSGYGILRGRRGFQVDHLELPLNGLSSALSHLSIVQLTDIHLGPFMPAEELAGYVEAVNRLKPDLVALTGDFVSLSRDEIGPCVETLAGLRARYGVYACLGNHDLFVGGEKEMTRLFSQRGVRVLRNDAVSLRVGNTTLNVLGIDDLRWGQPDLSRALRTSQGEPGEVRLLLSHRPEVFPEASRKGLDLVLSGHYHGGQVKLAPYPQSLSIARFITPYAEGLFRLSARSQPLGAGLKDSLLFVSRGIGITGLPVRINCPPQIAHLTLKRV